MLSDRLLPSTHALHCCNGTSRSPPGAAQRRDLSSGTRNRSGLTLPEALSPVIPLGTRWLLLHTHKLLLMGEHFWEAPGKGAEHPQCREALSTPCQQLRPHERLRCKRRKQLSFPLRLLSSVSKALIKHVCLQSTWINFTDFSPCSLGRAGSCLPPLPHDSCPRCWPWPGGSAQGGSRRRFCQQGFQTGFFSCLPQMWPQVQAGYFTALKVHGVLVLHLRMPLQSPGTIPTLACSLRTVLPHPGHSKGLSPGTGALRFPKGAERLRPHFPREVRVIGRKEVLLSHGVTNASHAPVRLCCFTLEVVSQEEGKSNPFLGALCPARRSPGHPSPAGGGRTAAERAA